MVGNSKAKILFGFIFYFYILSLVFGSYSLFSPNWVTTKKGNTFSIHKTCATCTDAGECQLWLSYQDNFGWLVCKA